MCTVCACLSKLPPIWWRTRSRRAGAGGQPLAARGHGRAPRNGDGGDDRPRRPRPLACMSALLVPVSVNFGLMTRQRRWHARAPTTRRRHPIDRHVTAAPSNLCAPELPIAGRLGPPGPAPRRARTLFGRSRVQAKTAAPPNLCAPELPIAGRLGPPGPAPRRARTLFGRSRVQAKQGTAKDARSCITWISKMFR